MTSSSDAPAAAPGRDGKVCVPLLLADTVAQVTRIRFADGVHLQESHSTRILDELEWIATVAAFPDFVVDLALLKEVGPIGLLFFLAVREHAQMRGGRCIFFNAGPAVTTYIREHHLVDLLQFVDDQPTAIRCARQGTADDDGSRRTES